ncbi:hypothetical protein LINPERHAP2_LOCUS2628 [Linum perenne]
MQAPWEKKFLTAVYGSPSITERAHLWESLCELSVDMEQPWILSGDFIAMLRQDDKRGGAQFSLTQNQPFIDCYSVCGLLESSFFGPKFTWHRGGTSEWLDRALTNEEWRVKFLFTKTRHLSRVYSDHRPILTVSEDIDRVRLPHPFRFVAAWLGHEAFQSTLTDAWG